jgi:hypothetical protein
MPGKGWKAKWTVTVERSRSERRGAAASAGGGAGESERRVEGGTESQATWSRPGPVGPGLEARPRPSEDGLHREGILQGGDDAEVAATAGAGEDIEVEHPSEQRRPGTIPGDTIALATSP